MSVVIRSTAIVSALAAILSGSQLPLKSYTAADGLPSNTIQKIVSDYHGYLWFCTPDGLSRFDGYRFTNYSAREGLPSDDVRDLLVTRGGQYWVATSRGLVHFHMEAHPEPRSTSRPNPSSPKFEVYRTGANELAITVEALSEDRSGAIWVGTDAGLFRFHPNEGRFEPAETGAAGDFLQGSIVHSILEDRRGDLWVGAGNGLYRRHPNGSIERFTMKQGLPTDWINTILEDRQGRIWVGTRGRGLCVLVQNPLANQPIVARRYRCGLPDDRVRAMLQDSSGRNWAASNSGLVEFSPAVQGSELLPSYTSDNGLSESDLTAAATDTAGNLWLGSGNFGAMRIARNGFVTFQAADGLPAGFPTAILESSSGELLVLIAPPKNERVVVNRFDGVRFHAIVPSFGAEVDYVGWSRNQVALQAGTGEWWFVNGPSVRRFPHVPVQALAHTYPEAVYGVREGFNGRDITHIFEDSRGDIWAASHASSGTPPALSGVSRWTRVSNLFHHYSTAEMPGVEIRAGYPPSAFAEDGQGNVWMAVNYGVLARYREGRFASMAGPGLATGWIEALYSDRAGRIWVGDQDHGLTRIDNPGADRPDFHHYGTAQGLSSNAVHCITEDRFGRIYVGAGPGVDRLDPATGQFEHYTQADGLAKGDVEMCFLDRQGALWFGTRYGISRWIPERAPATEAAQIRVTGIRVRGVARPVSDLGETAVSRFQLGANQNQLQIDFSGLGFISGERRYQYMLEGSDGEWSPPTLERTVNYASLSPGSYRFLVRAASAAGLADSTPATVAFEVLSPLWQRWWFLSLTALAALWFVHATYSFRLARLEDLQRVRMGIARDLHDDIGASLSQIALLSEVLIRQVETAGRIQGRLEQIGAVSRELVDSMSDIVWSVNPQKDTLGDLTQRMRAFASDDFPARNIAFQFRAPSGEDNLKLSTEVRRQVFLIFKESVNNIVRHSQCSQAEIDFTVDRQWLALQVSDDGRGFDYEGPHAGHGLANMSNRARGLGGDLRIVSGPNGTTVRLRVPTMRRDSWQARLLREYAGLPSWARRTLKSRESIRQDGKATDRRGHR